MARIIKNASEIFSNLHILAKNHLNLSKKIHTFMSKLNYIEK